MKKTLTGLTVLLALWLAAAPFLPAQEPYKLPPKEVIAIVDAKPTPRVSMSPARDIMALIEYEAMPTIAYISQPLLRIAGIRITPANNSRQVLSFNTGLSLKDVRTGAVRRIALPDRYQVHVALVGARRQGHRLPAVRRYRRRALDA